jgi:hypothetical protein
MKWPLILNFIPFLIWSLGFAWLMVWDEGRHPTEESTGMGEIWIFGGIVFLLIGVFCS